MTIDGLEVTEGRSPRGRSVVLLSRPGTSDLSVLASTFGVWGRAPEDEYRLGDLPDLSGHALDIGAHVGSVTLALLVDNPGLTVTAVEPLAENCEVLRTLLAANSLTARCEVVCAALARGRSAEVAWGFDDSEVLRTNRYIGGLADGRQGSHRTATVTAVMPRHLVRDDTVLVKMDCEGCEDRAYADPALARVRYVIAEGHGAGWMERAQASLGATHDFTVLAGDPSIGVYRAVAR